MASVQKRNRNGKVSYIIQFVHNGIRKSVSLSSDYSITYAKTLASIIDQLVSSSETGLSPPKQTASWIHPAPSQVKQKLANVGLVSVNIDYTINELFGMYMNVKNNEYSSESIRSRNTYFRLTSKYLDHNTKLSQFNKKFAALVCEKVYADKSKSLSTQCGVIKFIKALMNWAVKNEIIDKSPVSDIKVSSFKNKEREYFVSIDEYNSMLGATDDPEVRLALALYRIGGLRRSEIFDLSWTDVFEDRIRVYAHKTDRIRFVPLFPEIKDKLASLPNRTGKLFVRHVSASSITKKIAKARESSGVFKYPRILQNFRATRSNEVFRKYGSIAEQHWIGHSTQVAFYHYLNVTETEFKAACNDQTGCKNG